MSYDSGSNYRYPKKEKKENKKPLVPKKPEEKSEEEFIAAIAEYLEKKYPSHDIQKTYETAATIYEIMKLDGTIKPAPVVEDRPQWVKKEQEPKIHNNYPIRYKVDGEWTYGECFWNKTFGWQGYEIFDFEWLSEGQNT